MKGGIDASWTQRVEGRCEVEEGQRQTHFLSESRWDWARLAALARPRDAPLAPCITAMPDLELLRTLESDFDDTHLHFRKGQEGKLTVQQHDGTVNWGVVDLHRDDEDVGIKFQTRTSSVPCRATQNEARGRSSD